MFPREEPGIGEVAGGALADLRRRVRAENLKERGDRLVGSQKAYRLYRPSSGQDLGVFQVIGLGAKDRLAFHAPIAQQA